MKTTRIAVKQSVIIKPDCLRPHMILLLNGMLRVAPDTTDGTMWVTEGWRDERHPNDAHNWCNAWDVRSWNVINRGYSDLELRMDAWAFAAREALKRDGPFQFEAHGEGPRLHLHGEFDPR